MCNSCRLTQFKIAYFICAFVSSQKKIVPEKNNSKGK